MRFTLPPRCPTGSLILMFWDLASTFGLALAQALMAFLGWKVSAPAHKGLSRLFVALGVLSVVLTVAAAIVAQSHRPTLRHLRSATKKSLRTSVSYYLSLTRAKS